MNISIHTLSMVIDVPVCKSIKNIRNAMSIDAELQLLQTYIVRGEYWPIRHDMAIIDGVAMKDRQIIIAFSLQKQILDSYYMAIMWGWEKLDSLQGSQFTGST